MKVAGAAAGAAGAVAGAGYAGQRLLAHRLRARPVTTLCIACKSQQEAEERRRQLG